VSSLLVFILSLALFVLCVKRGPVRTVDHQYVELNGVRYSIEKLRMELADHLEIQRNQLQFIPEQLIFLDLQSQQEYHLVNIIADLDPFP